jgi:DNA-binding GntR family transcriptional regulator
MIELVGNARLSKLVAELRDQSRLYGLPSLLADGALAASAVEHVEILDAIAAGDAAGTELLMRKHLRHTRGEWAGLPELESGQ